MKEKTRRLVIERAITLTGTALLLSACGGGSSGSSGSAANAANLSDTQKSYESVALAANGGLHYVYGSLSLTTSSSGALSVSPSSLFYTDDSSLPQSPANGPQMLSIATTSLSASLKVPTPSAYREVINGAVNLSSVPAQVRVSYTGPNVREDYLAADGQTVMRTYLGTSYTVVPLTGLVSASPADLFANSPLGLITNSLNGKSLYNTQASWQAGAAYTKVVRQTVGDELFTYDCVSPATTGTTPTPCSTTASTLESFFPYASTADGKTYQLSDGQIFTEGGVRAWVANAQLGGSTTDYRVYYQINGGISAAYLIKDGTTLQVAPLGGGTPQSSYYFLNGAAVQTIKSAINF